MSKMGKRLIAAANEARAIARGEADAKTYRVHVPAEIDVQGIRKKLGLSRTNLPCASASRRARCAIGSRNETARKARHACCLC
jgi:hypothetical protein